MSWLLLVIAGMFESAFAIGLKVSDGFTKPLPSFLTAIAIALSMLFMSLAMRDLPVGVAYAIWVGIGVVGSLTLGCLFLHEPVNARQLVSITLIIAGVAGLKFAS